MEYTEQEAGQLWLDHQALVTAAVTKALGRYGSFHDREDARGDAAEIFMACLDRHEPELGSFSAFFKASLRQLRNQWAAE